MIFRPELATALRISWCKNSQTDGVYPIKIIITCHICFATIMAI
jgi:hypothetical protein